MPARLVRAFRGLYAGDSEVLRFGASASRVFRVSAGIRHGRPCSGSLFALAIDPVLRMLLNRIPRPLSTLMAYADDIALLLTGFLRFLPALLDLFAVVGASPTTSGTSSL